jgi:hypothetical protein
MKTVIIRAHFCFAKTGLSGGSAAYAAASRPSNPIAPHGLQKNGLILEPAQLPQKNSCSAIATIFTITIVQQVIRIYIRHRSLLRLRRGKIA